MPQASGTPSSRRFADDLRRIREARDVSLEDLHDETKIPVALIQDFERTALLEHPQFNRVYLRSFVRTYAQVVGIAPDLALGALEEALDGRYHNRLAVEYLGEKPPAEEAVQAATLVAAATPPAPVEPVKAAPRRDAPERPRPAAVRGDEARPARSAPAEDWTAMSPPPGKRAVSPPGTRRTPPPEEGGGAKWLFVGAGVVAVAALAWFGYSMIGRSSRTDPAAADSAAVRRDTVAATPPPAAARPVPALGDSMRVVVLAANGKLDPIRITLDGDLRRPFWVEQGDSLLFKPTQRIILEDRLDNIQLRVEGESYPTRSRDAENRLIITRDSAQAFLRVVATQRPDTTRAAAPPAAQ